MITSLANHITSKLTSLAVIRAEDQELYSYGLFLLISHVYVFVIVLFAGMLLSIPLESILFYIVFMVLRTYAGGVHAKTETACTLLTTLAMVLSVLMIRLLPLMGLTKLFFLIFMGSCVCVVILSPLDSAAKPLSVQEKKKAKIVCYVAVCVFLPVAVGLHHLSLLAACYAIVCAVLLESVLLAVGKLGLAKARKRSS